MLQRDPRARKPTTELLNHPYLLGEPCIRDDGQSPDNTQGSWGIELVMTARPGRWLRGQLGAILFLRNRVNKKLRQEMKSKEFHRIIKVLIQSSVHIFSVSSYPEVWSLSLNVQEQVRSANGYLKHSWTGISCTWVFFYEHDSLWYLITLPNEGSNTPIRQIPL